VTAWLKVDYKVPTRAEQWVVFKSKVDKVDGRKVFVSGTVEDISGTVLAKAEYVFADYCTFFTTIPSFSFSFLFSYALHVTDDCCSHIRTELCLFNQSMLTSYRVKSARRVIFDDRLQSRRLWSLSEKLPT
jgi:hypothetical protein